MRGRGETCWFLPARFQARKDEGWSNTVPRCTDDWATFFAALDTGCGTSFIHHSRFGGANPSLREPPIRLAVGPQPAERSPDLHYYLAEWPTIQMVQSIGKIAEVVGSLNDRFNLVLFEERQKIHHVLP